MATTIDPESRSANHPFDIIVTADDEHTLNENARAIAHEGDTYFDKCNLAAWRLQYCIDNDTNRFSWAQQAFDGYQVIVEGMTLNAELVSSNDTTHAGYPYRLLCDFQGITLIIYSNTLESDGTFAWVNIGGGEDIELPIAIHGIVTEDGKGVIYRMIDENNNDIPYDFKGIQFKRYKIIQCDKSPSLIGTWASSYKSDNIEIDVEDFRWCYLFNVMFDDLNEDDSVGYYLFGNRGNCTAAQSTILINGVCNMYPDSDLCYGWTCGNSCFGWTCGDNCYSWTCGNNCYSWTCGNNCHSWTCGDGCSAWICDNSCTDWACGDGCKYWICGSWSYSWTCGNSCDAWTCGNGCSGWTCGDMCNGWTCSNGCSYWICGNSCSYWTCGNDCKYWTLQTLNICQFFKILNGVQGGINNLLTIPFVAVTNYQQVAGLKTDGTLRVWNPADV